MRDEARSKKWPPASPVRNCNNSTPASKNFSRISTPLRSRHPSSRARASGTRARFRLLPTKRNGFRSIRQVGFNRSGLSGPRAACLCARFWISSPVPRRSFQRSFVCEPPYARRSQCGAFPESRLLALCDSEHRPCRTVLARHCVSPIGQGFWLLVLRAGRAAGLLGREECGGRCESDCAGFG